MNVVVVYGQKHKGNTYQLTQMLLSRLHCTKEDIKEYSVNGISHCVGCCQCILKDEYKCPHREETEPIITAIEQADVVIFATPNYCFNMSGQLKSFCDHMAYRWMVHRPYDMRNKIGVAISTAAGGGAGVAARSVTRQFLWWSVGRIYKLTFSVMAAGWDKVAPKRKEKLAKKVERLAVKINKKAGHSKPSLKTKCLFWIMKKMHAGASWNELDTNYWKEQGWIS